MFDSKRHRGEKIDQSTSYEGQLQIVQMQNNPQNHEACPLSSLPSEIKLEIFKYIDTRSAFYLALTSTEFYDLYQDNAFWLDRICIIYNFTLTEERVNIPDWTVPERPQVLKRDPQNEAYEIFEGAFRLQLLLEEVKYGRSKLNILLQALKHMEYSDFLDLMLAILNLAKKLDGLDDFNIRALAFCLNAKGQDGNIFRHRHGPYKILSALLERGAITHIFKSIVTVEELIEQVYPMLRIIRHQVDDRIFLEHNSSDDEKGFPKLLRLLLPIILHVIPSVIELKQLLTMLDKENRGNLIKKLAIDPDFYNIFLGGNDLDLDDIYLRGNDLEFAESCRFFQEAIGIPGWIKLIHAIADKQTAYRIMVMFCAMDFDHQQQEAQQAMEKIVTFHKDAITHSIAKCENLEKYGTTYEFLSNYIDLRAVNWEKIIIADLSEYNAQQLKVMLIGNYTILSIRQKKYLYSKQDLFTSGQQLLSNLHNNHPRALYNTFYTCPSKYLIKVCPFFYRNFNNMKTILDVVLHVLYRENLTADEKLEIIQAFVRDIRPLVSNQSVWQEFKRLEQYFSITTLSKMLDKYSDSKLICELVHGATKWFLASNKIQIMQLLFKDLQAQAICNYYIYLIDRETAFCGDDVIYLLVRCLEDELIPTDQMMAFELIVNTEEFCAAAQETDFNNMDNARLVQKLFARLPIPSLEKFMSKKPELYVLIGATRPVWHVSDLEFFLKHCPLESIFSVTPSILEIRQLVTMLDEKKPRLTILGKKNHRNHAQKVLFVDSTLNSTLRAKHSRFSGIFESVALIDSAMNFKGPQGRSSKKVKPEALRFHKNTIKKSIMGCENLDEYRRLRKFLTSLSTWIKDRLGGSVGVLNHQLQTSAKSSP